MHGNVGAIEGKRHGNAGSDDGKLADKFGLIVAQGNHLGDISVFTGGQMQSIAVSCQTPPGAVCAHVTKQQILLQIVNHALSRTCSMAQKLCIYIRFSRGMTAAKPK
ncbi:hypothetical protein D3C76_1511840 [compost metagenome]